MDDKDNKLVRQSYCKKCDGFIRAMALELIDGEELSAFEKEVEELDLEVETITLKEFKEKDREFCSCDREECKEYKLDTIQDIANMVTPDNIDNFMKDFRAFLLGYMTAQIASDIGAESRGEEKTPIPVSGFKWVDDGVVEAKITISSKESDKSVEIKLSDSRTQGEQFRDNLLKFIEKDSDIKWPSVDEFYEHEDELGDEEEACFSVEIGFQLDGREDIDGDDIENYIKENLDKILKGTGLEKEELYVSVEHMDAFPDGYHAYDLRVSCGQ